MVDKTGNYTTGESFKGPKDYFTLQMARVKQIPPLDAAEETELLASDP